MHFEIYAWALNEPNGLVFEVLNYEFPYFQHKCIGKSNKTTKQQEVDSIVPCSLVGSAKKQSASHTNCHHLKFNGCNLSSGIFNTQRVFVCVCLVACVVNIFDIVYR